MFFFVFEFLGFDIALQLLQSWWRQDAYGGERKGPKPGASLCWMMVFAGSFWPRKAKNL